MLGKTLVYHFCEISPERQKIEELKNLTTLSGSCTYYLHLFVVCDKFDLKEILDNEVTYPKNRNLLTRTI